MKKVLAVASEGGHWVELIRLKPAFDNTNLIFVSTNIDYKTDIEEELLVVTDANSWQKFKLLQMFLEVLWIIIKTRPNIIITTGAAPGFAAIFWGKIFGVKTVWIDSIANAEKMSSSGEKAKKFADVWLTQWKNVSSDDGPLYKGSVL